MKITLLGLCGLIAATGLLKAELDHLRLLQQPPPGPVPVTPAGLLSPQGKSTVDRSGLSPDEKAARREWEKRIGSLRLIKRNVGDGDETVTLRDPRRRAVGRVAGQWVDVELVRDLTGDGIPEVVLRAWSGGMHSAFVYYVYSCGSRPRCLLAYYKKNFESEDPDLPDFEAKDLDADGRQEIVSWYDGFAYWCEVPEWETCYAGCAMVPIVLGYRGGHYVDATSRHRAWLRQKLAKAKQHLLTDLKVEGYDNEPLIGTYRQGLIEYYSVALLLHSRRTARQMVLRLLPKWDRRVFRENCALIERVLAERAKRLEYPRAYCQTQAFASEALPPN